MISYNALESLLKAVGIWGRDGLDPIVLFYKAQKSSFDSYSLILFIKES